MMSRLIYANAHLITLFCRTSMMAALAAVASPALAQLPPAPAIPAFEKPLSASSDRIFTTIRIPERPAPVPIILHVSPLGNDEGDGSAEHPFASLARAQAAVRAYNRDHDVTVRIAEGIWPEEVKERNFFTPRGEYRVDEEATPTMKNSLM